LVVGSTMRAMRGRQNAHDARYTMKRFLILGIVLISLLFMASVSMRAQTPQLVYSDSLASPGESGNGFMIQYGGSMGTGSLSGNLITLRITAPHGSTVSSIADNLSDTYSLGS